MFPEVAYAVQCAGHETYARSYACEGEHAVDCRKVADFDGDGNEDDAEGLDDGSEGEWVPGFARPDGGVEDGDIGANCILLEPFSRRCE